MLFLFCHKGAKFLKVNNLLNPLTLNFHCDFVISWHLILILKDAF